MSARHLTCICALLLGCGGDEQRDTGELSDGERETVADSDGDGLCDVTEEELGTDPGREDSDDDGFPDLIELLAGTTFDTGRPNTSDLVFLSQSRGAQVDQEVRVTVEGGGEGHSGAFDALESPYPGADASDFYVGAVAVSAQPPDHVRGVEPDAQRFATVTGDTRLSFSLSFRHNEDVAPHPDCQRAYPFAYRVKAEGVHERAQVSMLLVVSPDGLPAGAPYCLPADCI